jgi:hypothetical protein
MKLGKIAWDRLSIFYKLVELIISILIAYFTYPIESSVPISLIVVLITFLLLTVSQRLLERSELPSRVLLRDPVIKKRTFRAIALPKPYKNWFDYSTAKMISIGLTPISYPSSGKNVVTMPAYEVFNFSASKEPTFREEQYDWQMDAKAYPFMNRVDREGTEDSENRITGKEIEAHKKTRRMRIDDNNAICVTGIKLSSEGELVLDYAAVRYWNLYVLVNQIGYMTRRFIKTELDAPINIVLKSLPEIKKFKYDVLKEIPCTLGVEVIVITKDGKFVFQRRSGQVAVHRWVLTPAVSAGYEPSKTTRRFEGWKDGALREIQNELGIPPDKCQNLRLLALVHIVPTGELNFIASMKVDEKYKDLVDSVREAKSDGNSRRISEHWEYNNLPCYDFKEVAECLGEWRDEFLRMQSKYSAGQRKFDRVIPVLHYAAKYSESLMTP